MSISHTKNNKFIHRIFTILLLCGAIFAMGMMASCSEDEAETEEFANWKSTNDTYWEKLYNTTKQKIANGDNSWKIILNYSFQNQSTVGGTPSFRPTQYIIVKVLEKGSGQGSPLYTDLARVHYQGRLIPSKTYTDGLIFDSSWSGLTYNQFTSQAVEFSVSGLTDGFSTALQNMNIGDHWLVYIPYQLAYDNHKEGNIPAFSNLIFDIRLQSYKRGI